MIIATCGHEIENLKDGVALTIKDLTGDSKGDIVKCITHGLYCQECADFYRRKNYVLKDKEAEEQWSRIGNSVPPKFMEAIAGHIKSEILEYENRQT